MARDGLCLGSAEGKVERFKGGGIILRHSRGGLEAFTGLQIDGESVCKISGCVVTRLSVANCAYSVATLCSFKTHKCARLANFALNYKKNVLHRKRPLRKPMA